jgi:hypothetical protein
MAVPKGASASTLSLKPPAVALAAGVSLAGNSLGAAMSDNGPLDPMKLVEIAVDPKGTLRNLSRRSGIGFDTC